ALGESGAGSYAESFGGAVVLPGCLSLRRRSIQQGDSLIVSPVLHQDFSFADQEKRTPDPGLHPVANLPATLQSWQAGIQCACRGESPTKKRLRKTLPVENMMLVHDLDKLFSERDNGDRILLNHRFHCAMMENVAAREVVSMFTGLTQTALAE